MSAIKDKALQDEIGWLYVATKVDLSATFLNNMTNAETLRTELDALTYVRVASITDLTMTVNLSDNLVEVEADDTGTLKKFTRPQVTIS